MSTVGIALIYLDAAKDTRGIADDLYIVGNVDSYAAEDGTRLDGAVPIYDSTAKVALYATEARCKLRTVENPVGIIALSAVEHGGIGRDLSSLILYPCADIVGLAFLRRGKYELYADYRNDRRHEKLPEDLKLENILTAEQKKYAHCEEYEACDLIALGDEVHKRGNDDKERPPAIKKDIKFYDIEGIQGYYRRYKYENYSPDDPTDIFQKYHSFVNKS